MEFIAGAFELRIERYLKKSKNDYFFKQHVTLHASSSLCSMFCQYIQVYVRLFNSMEELLVELEGCFAIPFTLNLPLQLVQIFRIFRTEGLCIYIVQKWQAIDTNRIDRIEPNIKKISGLASTLKKVLGAHSPYSVCGNYQL